MKYLGNVVNAYKIILSEYLKSGMTAIDATCGNGNDSLFLKQKIGQSGKLYAIDIQNQAIENTKILLRNNGYKEDENLIMEQRSHVDFDFLKPNEQVDLIIYNLGYLPKGDKNITTNYKSTMKSLNSAMKYIRAGGLIVFLCYRGHKQGDEEYNHLEAFLSKCSQELYDVLKMTFVNQQNKPPVMWIIEKK